MKRQPSNTAKLDNLIMIGYSHKTHPTPMILEIGRDEETIAEKLAPHTRDMVVLSTCNRFEAYLETPQPQESLARARELLEKHTGQEPLQLAGVEVAQHLFRVASGLESAILGDHEVLGQVRRALDKYARLGLVSRRSMLYRLFTHAIKVGRRVRRETGLSRGRIGYPRLAWEVIRSELGEAPGKLAVLGGGDAAKSFLASVCSSRVPARVHVITGSPLAPHTNASCTAEVVVKRFLGEPHWGGLRELLAGVEAIVVASERWSLGSLLDILVLGEGGLPEIIVSLVDHGKPDLGARHILGKTRVFTMEDLEAIANQRLSERARHVGKAESIVKEELEKLLQKLHSSEADQSISLLMRYAEKLRREEVLETLKHARRGIDEELLSRALDSYTRRLLHPLIMALRDTALGANPLEAVEKRLRQAEGY